MIPPDEVETPLGIGLIRLFAVAGLLAAALFGAVHLATRPVERPGHRLPRPSTTRPGSISVAPRPTDWIEESWISPRFELLARKHHRGAELRDAEFR